MRPSKTLAALRMALQVAVAGAEDAGDPMLTNGKQEQNLILNWY